MKLFKMILLAFFWLGMAFLSFSALWTNVQKAHPVIAFAWTFSLYCGISLVLDRVVDIFDHLNGE